MVLSPIAAREFEKRGDKNIDQKDFLAVFNKRMAAELGAKKLDNVSVETFNQQAASLLNTYSLDYKNGLEKFLTEMYDGAWEGDVKLSTRVKEDGIITAAEVNLLRQIPGARKLVSRSYHGIEPVAVHETYSSSSKDYGRGLHIYNRLYIDAKRAIEAGDEAENTYPDRYSLYKDCPGDLCEKRKDVYTTADYEKYIAK
jgi:hypothetical protein